ncbi:MAG: hypothetical protein ACWA5W_08725 [Phycisphaerales bacterium]
MPKPASNPDPCSNPIIASTNKQYDAAQIVYGLELRGVRARSIYDPANQAGVYQIQLITPNALKVKIAEDSIESIWDAILDEYPRAITQSGHCYFCRYDVTGLPHPTTCPECGHNLDSIDARRAMRDGKKR